MTTTGRSAKSQPGAAKKKGQAQPARSTAEWLSLGLSLAIVLTIAGLVVYAHLTGSTEPALISVQPRLEGVRSADGLFYLPLSITNAGGETAESLAVTVSLATGSAAETAEVTLPFLAEGESVEAIVAFQQDPAAGELSVTLSYLQP